MTHLKKSLALLLAFVMIFSSMSVAASAFDPKVDGGFNLDYTVKFFREDAEGNWVETERAKPGENVKARVYIGTDFYTYFGNMALLFDSRFLDNPTFEDHGVSRSLVTNKNYMGGAVELDCDNAGWHSDETQYNQNVDNILVTEGIISEDYFDDYDIIANTIEISSGETTLLSADEWAIEYDLQVYDNEYTRTVGTEGTARVPEELAASTTSPYPMFINMPKGEAGTNIATQMYFWDANVSSVAGVLSTTSNIILDANGGYYLVDSRYELTKTISGIIGDKVTELGSVSPTRVDYIHSGWSEIPVPADRTITAAIKEELGLSDADVEALGGVLTADQVEELTLSPVEIAALEYDYEDTTLYAVWTASTANDNYYTYQVYYMLPDGTYSDTCDYSQQIIAETGAEVALVQTPVEGFSIDTEKSDDVIIVKGDKSSVLKAYYARNKYTVTYHYADGAGEQKESDSVYYGAAVPEFKALPANPVKEGYTFTGWETAEGDAAPSVMPAKDVDLYPVFTKNSYTYIFDATQGGTFASNGERTVSFVYEYGETPVDFTEEPVFPGKEFLGWSEEIPSTVTGDMTFVADYSDVEYKVEFKDGDETIETIPYFYGDVIYAEDVPAGYKAENSWYVENADGSTTVVAFPYTVTGNTVLNAVDEADVYDAEFYVDGVLYDTVPTIFGEEIIAPDDPAKTGYTFKMWDPEVGIMDAEGKIYNAVFEIKTTKISFVNTGDTVIDPIEGEYNTPVTTAVPAPERKGYTFAGWNTPIPTVMPAEDIEIGALWTKNTYSIRFVNHDGSLIDVVTGLYESDVTAPALPVEEGFTYAWDKTVPETMPAENMTVTAVRTPIKYSVSFDTNGGVPATIAPIENVNCGDAIVKPADPTKEGYTFGGWAEKSDPDAAIDFPETMPAGGLELVAIWNAKTHDAIFDAAGGVFANGNSVVVVENVEYGTDITAPADPTKDGYIFDGWNPVPDKMADNDMTFTAKWIPDPSGSVEYKINVVTINPADGTEIAQNAVTSTAKNGETVEVVLKGASSTADKVYYYEDLINSVSNVPDTDRTGTASITVKLGEDNIITVYYKLADVTVTFLANGGVFADNNQSATVTGKYGEAITAPAAPTRTGYKFTGWDKTVEGATFTAAETYTAQWEAETYYAIFNINGEEYAKVPYKFGEKITAPAYTAADGTTFSGWNVPANTVMGPGDMTFDAKLTDNEYTLSYNYTSAPAGAELPASSTGLKYNDEVTVAQADEIDGYTFDGWYNGNEKVNAGDKITVIGDVTLIGSYTAISYSITYNAGSDATVTDGATTSATVGQSITLPTASKDGYTFKGWEYDGATYGAGASFTMPAEAVEFDAIWEEIPPVPGEFDVSYSWSGDVPATVTLPATTTATEGSTVTVDAVPTADGYTFSGWYYNGKLTESFVMPAENVTLTGTWTKDEVPPTKYELSLDANEGAFADGSSTYTAEFEEGQTVVTPGEPTKNGYKFAGWVDANGNAASLPSKMPANPVDLTASWSELYDITFVVDGETYDTAVDAGEAGDSIPVPSKGEPTKDGFTFAGWVDAQGNPVTTIPQGDTTVTAAWDEIIPDKYTIKYYDGSALLKSEQYEEGEVIADYAPDAKEGYTFNGWTGMPADGKMPAEDIVVHADWSVNKNDITLDAGEGEFADGSSIFTEDDVAFGSSLSGIVPLEPTREGYDFAGWVDANGNPADIPATMPDGEIDLKATWEIKEITITFDAGDGEFADGESTKDVSGDYGSDINVPAEPTRDGFIFKGWNGLPSDGKMPAEDITVTAEWEAEIVTYTLTIDAAGGTVDGKATIVKELAEGEDIGTISDPVRDGYTFKGWNNIPADGKMPAADLTITATWEAEATPTHTVTYYLAKDGAVYATKTFEEGETMVHPDPVAEGIVFKGWADAEGNPLPEKMGDKDLVAYAVIDYVKSYKATYVVEGETYKEYDVTYGSEIPVPTDPAREGFIFAGWRDADGKPVAATMPAKDVTYTALWEKAPETGKQFTAKFIVDGETHAFHVLEEGDAIPVPPTPEKFGYKFVGWEPEVPATMPAENMEFVAQWEIDKEFVTIVIGGAVVSGAVIGTAIGINAALITGAAIIGGILVIVGISELVKKTHTVTYMVDGEVYKTYKVVEGTKIPVPADPEKDGSEFTGWTPEVPEKMGSEDLVFEATWSDINVAIPDTGSAAGLAAFAAISGAAAAAYVLTNRKKKDEE